MPTPHEDALLSAATELGPLIREHAAAGERAGTPERAVVDALVKARLFDAYLPEALGGLGAAPRTLLALVEQVAFHDGSTGWCLGMGGIIGALAATHLPDAGAREMFSGADPVLCAGGFVPRLRAEPVDGGHRVSGRFPFASGCRHADWMVVTGIVVGETGPGAMRTFCVRADEVEIVDNWHVAGLEGTASNDLDIASVFVPDDLSFASIATPARRGGPMWRIPLLSLATIGHLGFALGVPRRALEEVEAHAQRQRLGSTKPIVERGSFQRDYGRARTKLRAARLAALESLDNVIAAGDGTDLAMRGELAAATAHAYATANEVCEFAFRAGGASSLYRTSDLQRCFRDMQAGAQHVVASEEAFERAAQVWLGVGEPGFL